MAIGTIAGLTWKEAVRRRTLVGVFLLGLVVLGLSLLLIPIHLRQQAVVAAGRRPAEQMAVQYVLAQGIISTLSLFAIRVIGILFAILLAGGAISGEIERGLLAVILPKPIPRWHILAGKWLGLNLILILGVTLWTVMAWASLTLQTGRDFTPLLSAIPFLALYPILVSTVTLSLSTFAQRLLGTSLALALCLISFLDGIFNGLSQNFDVGLLQKISDLTCLLLPQGYVAWWVENATDSVITTPPRPRVGESSQFLKIWGETHLHFAHLDAVYVALYLIAVFILGAFVLQNRDVG